jgi:3-oxoacyl-[acyl-carrier-protein] synthase II
VAITGLGAVSPNGTGRERFWSATREGRSGVRRIESFDCSTLPTRIAAEVIDFDPADHVPKRELKHVSRAVPLALAAAGEALEDAGIEPSKMSLEERRDFSVLIGSGGAGLEFSERQWREYYLGNPKAVSVYTIPSSTPGTISSEISMRFDLRGSSQLISTGCTSSTDALGYALSLVRYGRARRVLSGGTDAPLAEGIFTGFCLMKIMTRSWNDEPRRGSRPFSADRDGFVLGEGAWMLVLEDLEDAVARGARIYAEVLGYGATCEAFHRVRMDDSGVEPARAMQLALTDAGISAAGIDYIHTHGTSTVLNDRVETRAIRRVFGGNGEPPPVSSVKSMIGHPQGASGAAGVAATLLAMREGFLPPTINRDAADPECDLDVVPHSGRNARLDAVLCNCIGFGSKNAALVLGSVAADGSPTSDRRDRA